MWSFLKRKSVPEHYNNLDAPISVWEKVTISNDVTFLLVKRHKVSDRVIEVLKNAWENIFSDYIKEFGWSEHFLKIKEKEIEIATLQADLLIDGDRINETFIEIAKEELQDLQKINGKMDFMKSKIAIEDKHKFQLNMQTTSIREFYSYLKNLK